MPSFSDMNMKRWKTTQSKYLFRDRWLTVRADHCKRADGLIISPYYVLEYPDWVHVVALDSKNRVLVTRQYRHAIGKICVELPSGHVERGERPLAAARRELREETGCTAAAFVRLPRLLPNPASHTNTIHTFLATPAAITRPPDLDESEEITCEFLPIPTLFRMIDSGEFAHGLHIASLVLALRRQGLLDSGRR